MMVWDHCEAPAWRLLQSLLETKSRSTRALYAAYRTPGPASAGANTFGGPRRRGTDVLMAINVAVFLAQFISKDRLLLLGAKVVFPHLPDSSAFVSASSSMSVH